MIGRFILSALLEVRKKNLGKREPWERATEKGGETSDGVEGEGEEGGGADPHAGGDGLASGDREPNERREFT